MRIVALAIGLGLAAAPLAALGQGVTQAIPGDGGWELTTIAGGGCFARLATATRADPRTVDTILAVNNAGLMALSAGRPDWSLPSGEEAGSLRIDSRAPVAVRALPVGNFVMVLIKDAGVEKTLRNAHRLTWRLPSGEFRADVSGIGKTFDIVRHCGAR
jgi:hypothetical protein